MIVEQVGYLKLDKVIELTQKGVRFCIYKTHKNTNIIIINPWRYNSITIYYPKKDRLPYKLVEGKKIISGEKVFDSESKTDILDTQMWNNGNQIMAYKEHGSSVTYF